MPLSVMMSDLRACWPFLSRAEQNELFRLLSADVPQTREALEQDWPTWVMTLFPGYVQDRHERFVDFAPYHRDFWAWLWAIQRGIEPRPFIGIWPRGGAKSTSAELGCVCLGARGIRKYGVYLCNTQDQADDHVSNIAAMLESPGIARYYPELGRPLVGKYGNIRGWRRNRLRCANGFTVDGCGLDSAARGAKLDMDRIDLLVPDDIDDAVDSLDVIHRKIKLISQTFLPAGTSDLAVLGMQNLVHPESIFTRLYDGRADFLVNRIISGPYPALTNLAYEWQAGEPKGRYVITDGQPLWAGLDREASQRLMDRLGLTAFLIECQHDVEANQAGIYKDVRFQHCNPIEVPQHLWRIVLWCDPAVTDTDHSDSQGIQADGIDGNGMIFRLCSWEQRSSPEETIKLAIQTGVDLGADTIGFETDQGGDLWESLYWRIAEDLGLSAPAFASDKAGAGHGSKMHRGSLMLAAYQRGEFIHRRGTHMILEHALRRFGVRKPYDLADAAYWSWWDLKENAVVRVERLR